MFDARRFLQDNFQNAGVRSRSGQMDRPGVADGRMAGPVAPGAGAQAQEAGFDHTLHGGRRMTRQDELLHFWKLSRGIAATRLVSAPPRALADNLTEMLDEMSVIVECTEWPRLRLAADQVLARQCEQRIAL
jgi:hypothetical protein